MAEKENLAPRPWRVTIYADVTSSIEENTAPAHAGSMEDAVQCALDMFRMQHESDQYRIKKVEVIPNLDQTEQR